MARQQTEHQLQCAIVQYCDVMHYPCFAIPNGGFRFRTTARMLKSEGVRRGIPDLFLAAPRHHWHGFFIECKTPGNHPSPWQQEWIILLNDNGYLVQVHNDLEQAIKEITWYMEDGRG